MNKIDLIDRNSGLEYNIALIETFCYEVLKELEISDWEFSVLFSDDNYISDLNKEYRQKEGPTDVLTFCESDSDVNWAAGEEVITQYAGDIVISVETLNKNSSYFGVPIEEELKRLIIHGILHLKGMDHRTNKPDEVMLLLQEDILSRFGDNKF